MHQFRIFFLLMRIDGWIWWTKDAKQLLIGLWEIDIPYSLHSSTEYKLEISSLRKQNLLSLLRKLVLRPYHTGNVSFWLNIKLSDPMLGVSWCLSFFMFMFSYIEIKSMHNQTNLSSKILQHMQCKSVLGSNTEPQVTLKGRKAPCTIGCACECPIK